MLTAGFLFIAHFSAILSVLSLSLPLPLVLPLFASMTYTVMAHALRAFQGSIVLLEIGEEGILCVTRRGDEFECALKKGSYVSPWLAVLNLKCADGRSRSVVILPDSTDSESFRKLRVRLRLKFRI